MGSALAHGPPADPGVDARARTRRAAPASPQGLLVATMVAAVAVQAIGAFWYTRTSDERIFVGAPLLDAARRGSRPTRRSSSSCRTGRRRASSGAARKGHVERVGDALLHATARCPSCDPAAAIEGWALTCGRTPAQVLVLVDGVVIGAPTGFTPRPDVDQALHTPRRRAGTSTPTCAGWPRGGTCSRSRCGSTRRSDIRILDEVDVEPSPPRIRDLAALAAAAPRSGSCGPEQLGLLADDLHRRHALRGSERGDEHVPDGGARRPARADRRRAGPRRRRGARPATPRGADRERTGWSATTGCRTRRPSARWAARSRPTPTTRRWPGGSPARAPRDPRLQRMLADAGPLSRRAAACTGRGWPRVDRYQCLDPGRDPNPPDLVDPDARLPDAARARSAGGAEAVHGDPARGAATTSIWSTTPRRRWCRTCAAPSSAASGAGCRCPRRGWRDPHRDRSPGARWCACSSARLESTRRTRHAAAIDDCSPAWAATTSPCSGARRRCCTTTT